MDSTAQDLVQSELFKKSFTFLGILFILITPFISLKPDAFLRLNYIGVFIFNTVSSGLLIIPSLSQKLDLPLLVLSCALGNCVNTSVNYFVGSSSEHLFSNIPLLQKTKEWMREFGLWVVYALAILPLPLDVNGLLSGYVGIPYKKYLVVNFLGKITIFFVVALGITSFLGKR